MTTENSLRSEQVVTKNGAGHGGVTRARSWSLRLDLLFLGLILVSVALMHLLVSGPVPSGADSGNWLAMAKEILGFDVMSSDVTYPFVFPGYVASLLTVSSEVTAISIAGLTAKLVLVGSVYWCLRGLGRGWAAIAAIIVAAAGAQLEAYAWGGFAQLLGTGAGLLAVFYFGRYLVTPQKRNLFIALAWAALVYGTHSLVAGLLVIALGFGAAYWLVLAGISRGNFWRSLLGLLVVAGPGVVVVVTSVLGSEPGVVPVLNPHGLNAVAAIQHAIREAPLPWLVIAVVALIAFAWPTRDDGIVLVKVVGMSWVVSALGFFWYSGEPRALLIAQTGVVILAVSGAARFVAAVGESGRAQMMRLPAYLLGFGLMGALVVAGVASYVDASSWYRVVDTAELRALDTLAARAAPDDLVLAAAGHHGNPIGWWVEGYAGVPTYSSIDVDFLSFPDERRHAVTAASFFSDQLSARESRALVESTGADYLVVDRRGANAAWLESEAARGLPRLVNTGTIVILSTKAKDDSRRSAP